MTPHVKGVWRWRDENTMHFTPDTHLDPQTAYKISFEQVPMPTRIIAAKTLYYKTPPQACNIKQETVFIDPSIKAQHVVSFPLQFIWPVERTLVEQAFSVNLPKESYGLRLGAPNFVWKKDACVVNLPILTLPSKSVEVTAKVSGFLGWYQENNHRIFTQQKKVERTFVVKGADAVMDVLDMRINPGFDANLNRVYDLQIKTTLQVKPKDVLNFLDLFLLPQKRNATDSQNCDWEHMPAIGQNDLKASKKISAELLQPNDEPNSEIVLRLPVPEGRGVLCAMKPGLTSTSGFSLGKIKRFVRTIPKVEPGISFLQPGHLLPLKKGQKLAFHSMGLERIKWQASKVRSPYLALLAKKAGFTNIEDVDFSDLSEVVRGTIDVKTTNPKDAKFITLDLASLEGKNEAEGALLALSLKGYVGDEEKCTVERLLLISDLGVVVKRSANGVWQTFVRSLEEGHAVQDCVVEILGNNGVVLVSGTTDKTGRCNLTSTKGLDQEKTPTAVVCRKGSDFAWLSLTDESNIVDYGDHAVAGKHAVGDDLVAMVFSERGIYMPGETLHFGVLLAKADGTEANNVPLEATLSDPNERVVSKQKIEIMKGGMGQFFWSTPQNVPTGTFRLDVNVQGQTTLLGSKSVRVEEFQPDTLALRLDMLEKPKGWVQNDQKCAVKVQLTNLYGEPAQKNKIQAVLHTSAAELKFNQYSDYTFMDQLQAEESQEIVLPPTTTDDKGEVVLNIPLEKLGMGTKIGILTVEGFEKSGGRAVARSIQSFYSPRHYLLGYKPEGGA
ncbi:MAG: hypothetical protein IK079_00685, partial [Desulfovibrio sp.]|nr:hypothetical protein [Desulfovibrio sp.]